MTGTTFLTRAPALPRRASRRLDARRAHAELLAAIAAALRDLGRDPALTAPRACPVCATDAPSAEPALRAPVYDFHRCGGCTLLYTPRLVREDVVRERYRDTRLG